MSLEHYGFHSNYPLKFDQYKEFVVEKSDDMQNMIDSCSFKQDSEKNFFDQVIKFLFSAIKRRFNLSKITDQIKQKIIDKNAM